MKRTKTEKGITLIALIITVIILLILAVVAIGAVQNDGIIQHAKNARDEYQDAQVNEQTALNGYLAELDENNQKAPEKATVGTIVLTNSTIDGKVYSSTNPVIPEGFMAMDTDTAIWGSANGYKNGLVISDGISEFVWVPVNNPTEMYDVITETESDGSDIKRKIGKLYKFSSTTNDSGEKVLTSNIRDYSTTDYKEPAVVIGSDEKSYDMENLSQLGFATIDDFKTELQNEFDAMITSIEKYKGFYVGRYETSLDSNGNAQSKAGEKSASGLQNSANMWYGLYNIHKRYSKGTTQGSLIWGCQYDAMLRWMQSNNIDVSISRPIDTSRGEEAVLNDDYRTGKTGTVATDRLNNVYDLLGNKYEWTLEAYSYYGRSLRGGATLEYGAASDRQGSSSSSEYDVKPNTKKGRVCGRLSLYIN